MPWPSGPRRWSAGTATSSKSTIEIGTPFQPALGMWADTLMPCALRGTRKADSPLAPGVPPSRRATTTKQSAVLARVMNFLRPCRRTLPSGASV